MSPMEAEGTWVLTWFVSYTLRLHTRMHITPLGQRWTPFVLSTYPLNKETKVKFQTNFKGETGLWLKPNDEFPRVTDRSLWLTGLVTPESAVTTAR